MDGNDSKVEFDNTYIKNRKLYYEYSYIGGFRGYINIMFSYNTTKYSSGKYLFSYDLLKYKFELN